MSKKRKSSISRKKSKPIHVQDKRFEIRSSKNDSLEIDKPGKHFYIVLLESVTTVLIVLLGSMKEKYKYLINTGRMTKITNTINSNKINPETGKPIETVLQIEIKEISNILGNHIGYTDPNDNEAILKHLFDNPEQEQTSKQNVNTVARFKDNNDIK